MTPRLLNGSPLIVGGLPAVHEDCCCLDCSEPCNVVCGDGSTPPTEVVVTISGIPASYSCDWTTTFDESGNSVPCTSMNWFNLDSLNGTYIFGKVASPYAGAPSGDFCWLEREKALGSGIFWQVLSEHPDCGDGDPIPAAATLYLGGYDPSTDEKGYPFLKTLCTNGGEALYLHVRGESQFSGSNERPQCFHRSNYSMDPEAACDYAQTSKDHGVIIASGTNTWCSCEPSDPCQKIVLSDAVVTMEQV